MRIRLWPVLLVVACSGNEPQETRVVPGKDRSIEDNKRANRLEALDIRNYITRHRLDPVVTGTGVAVHMVQDRPGKAAAPGEWISLHYRVELLNGDTCYASIPGEPAGFLVEADDVESGLHEGVQFLSPGDSAIILIPSYRAYGLIGDLVKVPPRSTVVYFVGCVGVEGR